MGIGGVIHAEHHGQRRQALAPLLPQFAVTLFVSQRATERRAPGTPPAVAIFFAGLATQARIVPSGKSCGHAQLGKTIHHRRQRLAQSHIRIEIRATDKRHVQGPRLIVGQQMPYRRLASTEPMKEIIRIIDWLEDRV